MPRCDYDIIFFRVFCITLLGIAFTFTVILTNVFVDIDGLLNDEKVKSPKPVEPAPELVDLPPNDQQQEAQGTLDQINADLSPMYHYDKQYDYDGENNLDRSKRSLDTKRFKINVKNPKVKMLLSKQLSSLLEDLEEEESTTLIDTTVPETSFSSNSQNTAEKLKEIEREGVLHLATHNILLKGIINHMDLNDIYRTINGLNEEKNIEKHVTRKPTLDQQLANAENIENRFLEELANCTKLRKEILSRSNNTGTKNNPDKNGAKILINTVIDIKSVKDTPEKLQKKVKKENIFGVVKLLYNGKSVKFIDANDEPNNLTDDNMINIANIFRDKSTNQQENSDLIYKSSVDDYVSKFHKHESNIYPQLSEFLQRRRLKRSALPPNREHHKKDHKNPNEFYVEIETRFDKKDMDVSKKKQFVKELIKKIQKAIRTKEDPQKLTKISHQRPRHRIRQDIVQFKKRILSPLEDPPVKKFGITADHVVHRPLDPISKVVSIHEPLGPEVTSNSKDAWKDGPKFPSFLSSTKSINSAEVGKVNVEYENVVDGVPQRLQLPLNNNLNNVLDGQQIDVGNIKLSIKDLDGTGLAIGFNQLMSDSDKFVVYDGLENIFEHFPENYEQDDRKETGISDDVNDEFAKTMVSFHDIIKRSAQFDHPDRDTSQDREMNIDPTYVRKPNLSLGGLLGMGVMDKQKKNLNVQKYFNHRHNIKVKQYLNTNALSSKHKKYVLRNVPVNNRRKRDLSNIRILTDILPGDVISNSDRSQENVFFVSDENIFDENPAEIRRPKFADKTATYDKTAIDQYDRLPSPDDFVYRDVRTNQYRDREDNNAHERLQENERERERKHPLGPEHELENTQVYVHEQIRDQTSERDRDSPSDLPYYHMHDDLAKDDPNLSNYPHIMANKADDNSIHNIIFDAQEPIEPVEPKHKEIKPPIIHEPVVKPPDNVEQTPDLEELTNAIAPKTSYKVTVKLLPKNDTNGDGTGVKEVFTTINKTFNKNGLLYSRLVNVSEIAKIQSLNETNGFLDTNEKDQDQNHRNIMLNNKLKKSEKDLKELKQQREMLKDIINNNAENKNANKIIHRPTNIDLKKPLHDFLSVPPIPTRIRDTKKKLHPTTTTATINLNRMATPRLETPKMESKMTNAILAKIEENTNALKTFLQRLNKLEETPKRQSTFPTSHGFMPMQNSHSLQPPFVMPTIPNMDTHRNSSFIPFVYAFEHHFPSPNQTENNLSVVYHGHIHTKTGSKVKHFDISKLNSQKYNKRNALRSRFFLDDVGTVIGTPMNVFKYKNYIKNPKIKINSTILI